MSTLREELNIDPLGRGYATMTPGEVEADLKTEYRMREVHSLSGDEVFSATDPTEFAGLSDHMQLMWVSFCGRSTIDPWNQANVEYVTWIFGDTSSTVSSLGNMREESISRADELGLGTVRSGDIQRARSE